jgi:hypothetical protein
MLRTFCGCFSRTGIECRVVLGSQADHVTDRVLRRLRQRFGVPAERDPRNDEPSASNGLSAARETFAWSRLTI